MIRSFQPDQRKNNRIAQSFIPVFGDWCFSGWLWNTSFQEKNKNKIKSVINADLACYFFFPVKFSFSTMIILWCIVLNWKRPCFLKECSLACEHYYVQAGFTLERDNPPMWPHHFIACTQQLTFKDNHELPEKQCLYTNLWSDLAQDIKGNAKLLMIIDLLVSSQKIYMLFTKFLTLSLFCHSSNPQVLQQCLLCKSWGNHYNRDELSWGGLLIWLGFPFKCNPWHIPSLLCTSPKGNVADAATEFSRFFPKFRKITKGTFMLQRGWIIFTSKATTISCLIFLHFLNACNQNSSCRCSEPVIDLQIKSFCSFLCVFN